MFFVLPTWQYDCQFYPAFVCPINVPADIPLAAIAVRLAIGLGAAALAVAAFSALRTPRRAAALLRSALRRDGGKGAGAG